MTNEVRELFDFVASGGRSVLYDYGGSRAASTQEPREYVMVTELINEIITSRPAKKITYLNESKQSSSNESESEPEIIELGGKSKAASTPVNEVRELFNLHFG